MSLILLAFTLVESLFVRDSKSNPSYSPSSAPDDDPVAKARHAKDLALLRRILFPPDPP